jgi:hypothetical protein
MSDDTPPGEGHPPVKGDNDVVVAFYQRFAWQYGHDAVLQTIHPDKETVRAYTFKPGDEKGLRALLEKINGVENIYFQVNPLKRPLSGAAKASKEDVAAVHWLQADMDPSPLEDFDKERARILKALETFDPKANMIIDSGGGYQGFWALTKPLELTPRDDGIEPWAEAESRSQQLALLLSADLCFNCDRIMRTPGTVNVPNKKKRAKGRVPALAKIVHWDDGSYPLERFAKAPVARTSTGLVKVAKKNGESREITLTENVRRYSPENIRAMAQMRGQIVSDYTMMLIVQGGDPDHPGKYESRSEVLFRVCCELKRAQFTDDEIASICTDPDFLVSAHVQDQKRPVKYMARQIKRATDAVLSPELLMMNDRFAIIGNLGGKHVVVEEHHDEGMKRSILKYQLREQFLSRFAHQQVQVGSDDKGPKMVPLGKWWIDHPDARRYDYVVFLPGADSEIIIPQIYGFPIKKLNLWQGFGCEAIPGDCSLYLNHLRNVICRGEQEIYDYVIRWFARGVQYPDRQGEVAIVLKGSKGSGKSIAAKNYGSLFGRHYMNVTHSGHLTGNFNEHLRNCIFLFADEAFYAGDKKNSGVLKTLITEDVLMIEAKGLNAEPSKNCIHLMMASNDDWIVPTSADERRFLVLELTDEVAQNTAYFKALQDQMDHGGREALLHHLLSIDLTDFEVRRPPKTAALADQNLLSASLVIRLFVECLTVGCLPGNAAMKSDPALSWPNAFRDIVAERNHTLSSAEKAGFERELVKLFEGATAKDIKTVRPNRKVAHRAISGGSRPVMSVFRPLRELRREYANYVDQWPEGPADWQYEPASVVMPDGKAVVVSGEKSLL